MSVTTIIVVVISLLTPIYFILPSSKNDSSSTLTSSIKPCSNPDCIRCQNYNRIQSSARGRLPRLLHYYHQCSYGGTDSLERVASGVKSEIMSGPPPLSLRTILSNFFQNIIAMVRSFIPFCTTDNNRQYDTVQSGSICAFRRVIMAPAPYGQYPTVLLVPDLSVQPIVTLLHADTISVLVTPPPSHPLDTSLTCTAAAASTTDTVIKPKSIHEILLQEYIHSQENGHWLVNDTTPTDKYADTNSDSSSSPCWKVFHLINQGRKIQSNLDLCPHTYRILQSLRRKDVIENDTDNDVLMEGCMFGNVFFSVLNPGTRIEPHCGPTNVRHRMHFALSVPPSRSSSSKSLPVQDGEGEPVLKIQDGVSSSSAVGVHWKVGEVFVFDDSLMHGVDYYGGANDSDGRGEEDGYIEDDHDCDDIGEWRQYDNEKSRCRVVLIVDLWHPELTAVERRLLRDLYPAP